MSAGSPPSDPGAGDPSPVEEPSEHDVGTHGEPWLVSYADLMTLLFGFFVILYSFEAAKNANDVDMVKVRKELAAYFGGKYMNPIDRIRAKVEETVRTTQLLKNNVDVLADNDGMQIVIRSQDLFESGKAALSTSARPLIETLVGEIAPAAKDLSVRVEGHTDDNPIRSEQFPSNWELSSARAISVLRLFERAGFDPKHLQAMAFGDSHPVVPNREADGTPIPANQSQNRRVVIRISPR